VFDGNPDAARSGSAPVGRPRSSPMLAAVPRRWNSPAGDHCLPVDIAGHPFGAVHPLNSVSEHGRAVGGWRLRPKTLDGGVNSRFVTIGVQQFASKCGHDAERKGCTPRIRVGTRGQRGCHGGDVVLRLGLAVDRLRALGTGLVCRARQLSNRRARLMPREACRRAGNVTVRMRMQHTTFLLAAAAAAMAIATAPSALAAPSEQPCSDAGESTNCQRLGNVQVYTSPRALPRVLPHSNNPKWQAFGYNPKYSGFQPRPSVLRAPQLPVSQDLRCPKPSPSACTPRNPNATDTGGSTIYQTPGHAQITAQPGPAAKNAQQATYFPVSDLPWV
jgi:hypothetical protein